MKKARWYIFPAAVALVCLINLKGWAGDPSGQAENLNRLRDAWGIQARSLRLTAGGNMLDFRYQVTDPEKASALFKGKDTKSHERTVLYKIHEAAAKSKTLFVRQNKPYLIDQATGAVLRIPFLANLGDMRTNMKNPVEGKVYFMLFANPGMLVKKGGEISFVVGGLTVQNLTVE